MPHNEDEISLKDSFQRPQATSQSLSGPAPHCPPERLDQTHSHLFFLTPGSLQNNCSFSGIDPPVLLFVLCPYLSSLFFIWLLFVSKKCFLSSRILTAWVGQLSAIYLLGALILGGSSDCFYIERKRSSPLHVMVRKFCTIPHPSFKSA